MWASLQVAGLLLYLSGLVWLHRIELEAPPHDAVELASGAPATFYLPAGEIGPFALPAAEPGGKPPGVVLMHGYTGDRVLMSGLARALARAGYAVLNVDLQGHGLNRESLRSRRGLPGHFDPDVGAAVDLLERSRHVDGERIALVAHSMGARAALAYTTARKTEIDALVLIAGGWVLSGSERPPNALFLHAERDLPSVPEAARRLVAKLAHVDSVEPGRTYGDFGERTAVGVVRVAGERHGSLIRSDAAFRELVGWLDRSLGVSRTGPAAAIADRRPRAALVSLVGFLLLLPGLGGALARLAPAAAEPTGLAPARSLLLLCAALLVALPVFYTRFPGVLLQTSDVDRQVTYLALAGTLWAGARLLASRRGKGPAVAIGGSLATIGFAVAATVVVYLAVAPMSTAVRGLTLTPERFAIALAAAVFLLPLSLSHHALCAAVPAGAFGRRVGVALLGRALVLGGLSLGVALGAFEGSERVAIFVLLAAYAMLEIVFAAYYARSRSPAIPAGLECLWVGWFLVAVLPVNY